MSSVQRLIQGGNRAGTVSFDAMDRAAELSERVEVSKPMWKWVKENNKQPKCFSDWPSVIQEYHRAIGTPWVKDYSVPSPYGEMGYDTIEPPRIEVPAIEPTPVAFPCGEADSEENTDWFLGLIGCDE